MVTLMTREVSSFHSGKYLFDSAIRTDISVLADAYNFFSAMPLFPEAVSSLSEITPEKAVHACAVLENSSVTLSQVKEIIKYDRTNYSQDKKAVEAVNLFIGYKKAMNSPESELSAELIGDFHKELVTGMPDIKDTPGQYRKGGAKADEDMLPVPFTPPVSTLDVNFLIKNLLEWLRDDLKSSNPIVKAVLLHLHLKKIQPYINANGHTARLAEAWYLKKNNVSFLPYLMPVIYSKNKNEYYRCMSEFYQTSDINPFLEMLCKGLKETVGKVRDITCTALSKIVSDSLLQNLLDSKTLIKRQYDFLKTVKDEGLVFTYEDIQLKKPFTKFYGKVSRTTVSRDMKKFEDLGLLKKEGALYFFNAHAGQI